MPPVIDRARQNVLRTVPSCRHAQQLGIEDDPGAAFGPEHDGVRLVADVVVRLLVRPGIFRLLHRYAGRDHRAVVHVNPRLFLALGAVVEARAGERRALVDPSAQDADLFVSQRAAGWRHDQILFQARNQVDQAAVRAIASDKSGLARVAAALGGLSPPQTVAVHRGIVAVAGVAVLDEDRIDVAHEVDLAISGCRQFGGAQELACTGQSKQHAGGHGQAGS